MTTLTLILLCLFVTCVSVLAWDTIKKRARKRDRELVRRFHRYMDKVPPRNPW